MILGTIATALNTGEVTLLIDGEDAPTTKSYMWLASYRPIEGDRVLIEEISGTYVILGKLTRDRIASAQARSVENRRTQHDDGYVAFGIYNGELYYGLAPSDGSGFTMHKLQNA